MDCGNPVLPMVKRDNGESPLEGVARALRRFLFSDLDIVGSGFCRGLLRRDARCRSVRLSPRIAKRWPYPEILDPIASIYFVHRPSKKEDEGEEGQGRNHDAEAHSKNDYRVERGSVGN